MSHRGEQDGTHHCPRDHNGMTIVPGVTGSTSSQGKAPRPQHTADPLAEGRSSPGLAAGESPKLVAEAASASRRRPSRSSPIGSPRRGSKESAWTARRAKKSSRPRSRWHGKIERRRGSGALRVAGTRDPDLLATCRGAATWAVRGTALARLPAPQGRESRPRLGAHRGAHPAEIEARNPRQPGGERCPRSMPMRTSDTRSSPLSGRAGAQRIDVPGGRPSRAGD